MPWKAPICVPPVGIRLVGVISDYLQDAGQAAFILGVVERR
jgi:hypothetical protein